MDLSDVLILLTVCLILLKLAGQITLSWWAVTMPIWILPACIGVVAVILLAGIVLLGAAAWACEQLKRA